MSCPYCTPLVDEETGESLEFCKGFYSEETRGVNTTHTRLHLVKDEDGWSMVILLSDDWLSSFIHELGEPAKHAGTIATSIPAPPYCPWCGERLE